MDLYARMNDRLRAIPGVESVGMSQHGLMTGVTANDGVYIPGHTDKKWHEVYLLLVSPSFLDTMRIPILRGRGLSRTDGAASPRVVVVNQAFVRANFPGEDPIGKIFYLGDAAAPDPDAKPIQIVGVVKDAHYSGVRDEVPPTGYFPYMQVPDISQMTFAIRTVLPPLAITGAVRQAVAGIDRTIPVAEMRTEEDQIGKSIGTERLFAGLVSGFGALAALLAAIGLYGVMAYTVTRRTTEIGIRIALGATGSKVQWLVLRESLLMVIAGLIAGLPAAYLLTRLVKTLLYGVTPTDPVSFVAALILMIGVAAAAAWRPARRASRLNPLDALRHE
jgi:predicted permease